MEREITLVEGYQQVREQTYRTMCFDDLVGQSPEFQQTMVERGLVWMTNVRLQTGRLGLGIILAASLDDARGIAALRGLGEEIMGNAYQNGASALPATQHTPQVMVVG